MTVVADLPGPATEGQLTAIAAEFGGVGNADGSRRIDLVDHAAASFGVEAEVTVLARFNRVAPAGTVVVSLTVRPADPD